MYEHLTPKLQVDRAEHSLSEPESEAFNDEAPQW